MAWTKEGRAKWQKEHPEEYKRIKRETATRLRRRRGIPVRNRNSSLITANQRLKEKQKEDEIKAKLLEIRKSLKMQATK